MGLVICFYDRSVEVERLERLLRRASCLALVGPRNVGKRRYTLARSILKPIVVDACT